MYGYTKSAIKNQRNKSEFSSLSLQVKCVVDWKPIERILDQAYPKGRKHMGRKVHHLLILFKMSLLQTWNGLSDRKVEK